MVKAKTPRKKKEAAPKMTPKSGAKEGADVGLELKNSESDEISPKDVDTSKTNGDATTANQTSKDHSIAETDGNDKVKDNENVGASVDTSHKDAAPLTPDASPVTSTSPGPQDEADKPVDGDATKSVATDKDGAITPAKTPSKKRAAPKKATPKEATTTNGDTKEVDKKPAAAPKKRGRPTNVEKAAALAATSETVDGEADVNDSETEKPAPKKRKTAAKKKSADTSNVTEADAETVDGEESITVDATDTKATSKSPAPTAAAEKKKATPKPRTPKTPREPSKAAKAKQAKLDAETKEAEEEAQRATKEAEAKADLAVKKAAEAKAAKEANEVLMGKKAVATEVKEEEDDDKVNGDSDDDEE